MIHAFALEPSVVANWGRLEEFRFIYDKFGLGTPRVLLEIPAFTEWKNAVYSAAAELDLSEKDWKRIEELFRLFAEHKCSRDEMGYEAALEWLENAELEHDRKEFRAIVASTNPRKHRAVVLDRELGAPHARRWTCAVGENPERSATGLAASLAGLVLNSKTLHLVDPHFGPSNTRHRRVLEAIAALVASRGGGALCVHCSDKEALDYFEDGAKELANRLPSTVRVEFRRWRQRSGGEKFHNRYVLSDLGGVTLGTGLDAGDIGETDDLLLLPRAVFERRWDQYVRNDGSFEEVDKPSAVIGSRA